MKWNKSLIILSLIVMSGCQVQTLSAVAPSAIVSQSPTSTLTNTPTITPFVVTPSPIVTQSLPSTLTNTPTITPIVRETVVPTSTELPIIETGPRSNLDPTMKNPTITEIHMTGETSGWSFASSGDDVIVLHTSDGGTSWRDVTPPIEIWSAFIGKNEFYEPRFGEGFFLDEHRAWISTQIVDSYDAFTAKIMLSTDDGGATWHMRTLPGGLGVGSGRFVDFIDPMHGWFAVYNYAGAGGAYLGLYRTTNEGESWEIVFDALGSSSGLSPDLAFGDKSTGVMTFKSFGWYTPLRINWTQDGGSTWEPQYLPEPEDPSTSDPSISDFECGTAFPHAFSKLEVALNVECRMLKDAGSPNNEYIFTTFLYSTEDGGLSWQSHPAPSGSLYMLSPKQGWTLGNEIHFTEDGGQSWTKYNEVNWQGQFNFIDRHHGWAVARSEDEIALVRTENGGRTWMIVQPQLVR